MSRYGAFTVRTECARCGQPVPINGPFQVMHCGACQADTPVHDGLWAVLLPRVDDRYHEMPEGVPERFSRGIDGLTYHCSFARSAPRCDKCGVALPLDATPGAERDVFCTSCGDGASVYPAPEWLRTIVPSAQQIYSVDRGGGAEARRGVPLGGVVESPQPIVMPCPQCGGALHLGGDSERVVKCKFCSADVYLPDDLWRRLHPVRTVREWFVRFDGETGAQREQRQIAEREARRRQRESEAAAQQAAAEEDASAELDGQIDRLLASAYKGVVALCALMLVAVAWNVASAQVPSLSDARVPVGVVLLACALGSVVVAIILAGRPIQRRTGFDGEFMFFAQWFFLIFALAMPIAGQVMALVVGFNRVVSDTIGGSQITNNGHTKSYPVRSLPRGEGRPLGLVYVLVALLYPAAVVTLFWDSFFH
jgi:uncharacterized integral membrane protein